MKESGIIFDIKKSAIHDGPGIRTTIFLKGCALNCIFCHNPEAISPQPQLLFNQNKCVHCFACVQACPNKVHKNRDGKHILIRELCQACGRCVEECLYGALEIIGKDTNIEDIIKEIEKDRDYYDNSGGGVTLSGGDPLFQFEFALALLQTLKESNIHTCLDTNGCASKDKYENILPYVDLFLFDYKATCPEKHKEITGISNKIVLDSLDFLYKSKARIILRCPVIPGINDSKEHFRGIADLSKKYPELVGIEIMAYHALGKDKAEYTGREYKLKGLKTTDEQTKNKWINILKDMKCIKAAIG